MCWKRNLDPVTNPEKAFIIQSECSSIPSCCEFFYMPPRCRDRFSPRSPSEMCDVGLLDRRFMVSRQRYRAKKYQLGRHFLQSLSIIQICIVRNAVKKRVRLLKGLENSLEENYYLLTTSTINLSYALKHLILYSYTSWRKIFFICILLVVRITQFWQYCIVKCFGHFDVMTTSVRVGVL